MTRRAALTAVAAGLAVLAILAGGRWAVSGDAVPVAQWRLPTPGAAPVATAPTGATPSSAVPTPARSSSAPSSPGPTGSTPRTKASNGPTAQLDLRRTTGVKAVALTFDDGPHPIWTPKILDQLRTARVHATFCLVGTEAARYPALVARIVREGHTLCNHTWHHEFDLGTRTEAEIRDNLVRTNDAIRRAVPDARIRFFRHPGGKWTPAAVKVARELGMASLHWSVDPHDWAKPGAAVIKQRVLDRARSGSIVLLHDGGGDRSGTAGACPEILSTLKRTYGIMLLK